MRRKNVSKIVAIVSLIVVAAALIHTYTRRVGGVSMYPTLQEGDVVVIQPSGISSINVGDIIVYGPPCSAAGEDVIHRVVGITSSGLITQGDNRYTNRFTDQQSGIAVSPVTQQCIVGKVVFVIPYLDTIATLPNGLSYFLVAVVLIIIIFSELPGDSKDSKN